MTQPKNKKKKNKKSKLEKDVEAWDSENDDDFIFDSEEFVQLLNQMNSNNLNLIVQWGILEDQLAQETRQLKNEMKIGDA